MDIKKAPLGAILKGKIYVLQLKKQASACKKMVGVKGFEPSASWSQTTRATKLRHTPLEVSDLNPTESDYTSHTGCRQTEMRGRIARVRPLRTPRIRERPA